ncbi:MAG: hypothetical protein KF902_09830 [Phycisphaeraceae bacterium]|nr:hypothetical protein [Phycisphaeraceae bacterium]
MSSGSSGRSVRSPCSGRPTCNLRCRQRACLELSASFGVAVAISGTRGRRATRGAIVAPDGRDLTPRLGAHLRPEPAPHLVRAIGQAFALHEELLATGDEVNDVARRLSLHPGRAHHLLHLTRLSPDVIRAVLTGTIGRGIALTDLHAAADHIEWAAQHRHLRLPVTQG